MALPSSQVTIPAAQRAAARLGCAETFAIVDDQRATSLRRIWVAEQTDLHSYELREELGQGMVGREMDDPFALVYLQACQCNVQWLIIPPTREDGPKEIRDEFGQIIIHRILSLRDTYDRGAALSEAALLSKQEGEAIWIVVVDDSGAEVADAPVRIASREDEHDDNGNLERVLFQFEPDGKVLDTSQATQGASMPAPMAQAVQRAADAKLTEFVLENAGAPSGSQAGDDNLQLYHANDKAQDDDADEEDATEEDED